MTAPPPTAALPWRDAWAEALYGPDGFYHQPVGPAGHFRTSVHADAPAMARALLNLARSTGCTSILELGSGRGELLRALRTEDPQITLHGADVVPAPADLAPAAIGWSVVQASGPTPVPAWPAHLRSAALVVAHELLDVVPMPLYEPGESEPSAEPDDLNDLRLVGVTQDGREHPLPLPEPGGPEARDRQLDLGWIARWWPPTEDTEVIEVGRSRDELWAQLVASIDQGFLLAVDYGHWAAARPPRGSLTGFAHGRAVPPRPDGSCDLTAEVAWDSLMAAGEAAGARSVWCRPQAQALTELTAEASAELMDPGSLGGFTWLLQAVGPAVVSESQEGGVVKPERSITR